MFFLLSYIIRYKKICFCLLAFVENKTYHNTRNKQQKQQENGFFLSFVCSIFAVRKRTKGRHKGTAQNETRTATKAVRPECGFLDP